ncbi:MAG: serine hydrolase [Pseudomonadota bacterium]
MRRELQSLAAGVILAAITAAAWAQSPNEAAGPSPSIRAYRTHMFDEPVRTLANRSMALMFNTASVEAGRRASQLKTHAVPMRFSYEFGGKIRAASDVIERTSTDALLIIKHGVIVHEGYYNRVTPQTHLNSYSMAKSVNAIMIGLAIKQGAIKSTADLVTQYIPELRGSGYDGVTVRNLMEMRSGVAWDENFFQPGTSSYQAHVASWVEERARYTDAALKTQPEHRPGTYFRYNSMDAAVAGWLVERAVGMRVSKYLGEHLWTPAGMEADGFYVIDGPAGVGREFTAGGFNAVLRDYGRLGLLMLNNGQANRKSFLPPGFVADLSRDITNGDAEPGLGYGWFWWPVLGTKAVTALGGEGQYIFFDPDTQTVIIKMSHGPVGPDSEPIAAETLAFLKAASAWDGK